MRGFGNFISTGAVLTPLILFSCGYSQDEWDQKVRETEELREKLAGEQSARAKAEADYADALEEIEALRLKLSERGMSLDTLSADMEEQKKALTEYESRLQHLGNIRARFDTLRQRLEKLTKLGLEVKVRDNRMVIQLPGDVLFDPGRDQLKKEGKEILLQVAKVIREDEDLSKRKFQVAGHTDNQKPKGGRFTDNWALSALRARAVLVLLTGAEKDDGGGLPTSQWSAAGYSSTDPVSDNETKEGMQKNRRVELVVQPDVVEMINLNSIAENPPSSGN